MKYIWYLLKKVNFLFILYSTEIQKSQPYFLLGRLSFDLTFAGCLLSIPLDGRINGQTDKQLDFAAHNLQHFGQAILLP